MKIISLLNWHDEDPLALLQSVNDLAHIGVTDLIAVGGRYENFPEQPILRSRMSEIDAIASRCLFFGIGLTLDLPSKPWVGDEIAKRQRMLELADTVSGGEETWLCVWDADYRLHKKETVSWFNTFRSMDVLFTDNPTEEEPGEADWYRMKMFMRWEPGLHMGENHYTYVYGDGQELKILPRDEEPPAPLSSIRIRHLKYRRHRSRLAAQAAYYEVRDGQRLER